MKYLKLFERDDDRDKYWDNYINDLNNNSTKKTQIDHSDYYRHIEYDEASDHIENMIGFEEGEIDQIKEIFKDTPYRLTVNDWTIYSEQESKTFKYINVINNSFRSKIWKLNDEWYLISIGDEIAQIYYLCDQMEGLATLIKSFIIKTY